MASKQRMGCLPLWSIGCAGVGLLLAGIADPIGGPMMAFLLWIAGLPVCFIIALVAVGRKGQAKVKAATAPAGPKAPAKKDLAAQAKRKLDEAKALAAAIDDGPTRAAMIGEAEAKFRKRMRELME